MIRFRFAFLAPCLALAALSTLTAQQPDSSRPVLTLHQQVREVLLPVTVRDKHGDLVPSLSLADFALTEDGRPQVIKSLARESSLPFHFGLLVDTSRSLMGAMDSERKAAEKFVDTMLPAQPGADQAFLIHFDREVELLQDFTPAREKLHSELDDMGPTARGRDDSGGPETTGDDRERPRGGRGGTQLYDAIYLASSEVIKPGGEERNALVIFSDGADRGSKETLNEAIDAADKSNVVIYTIYFKGQQEDSGSHLGHMGGMGGSWPGGSGGAGYPGGGRRGGQGREEKSSVDGRKIMEQIATRTGGRYFEAKKKDNLEEIYSIIAAELRGQYLLTYTPDKPDPDGNFHKIALTCKKNDWTVSTREGYFAPGGAN